MVIVAVPHFLTPNKKGYEMVTIKKWVKTHFENKQQKLIDQLQHKVDDMYRGFKVDNDINREPKKTGRRNKKETT
jgi:hypothetical protein